MRLRMCLSDNNTVSNCNGWFHSRCTGRNNTLTTMKNPIANKIKLSFMINGLLLKENEVIFKYCVIVWWWCLPFPDTGCPVPDVSIYYMSNINELPDGILFHWFCKCTPPWMFLPLDIPSEYRPEHVTFGLLCVIFKFPSRIFCRRVPGFATDCPCGVWCRGLTTCLLYVGPPLEF